MTVGVIDVTPERLVNSRSELLESLHMSEEDLRNRVSNEIATAAEQSAVARLDEIAFLLGEDV
jgi:hypothetical protein